MPDNKRNSVAELLAPMLRKTLFVALNRVVAPASEIAPFVADHLVYARLNSENGSSARAG